MLSLPNALSPDIYCADFRSCRHVQHHVAILPLFGCGEAAVGERQDVIGDAGCVLPGLADVTPVGIVGDVLCSLRSLDTEPAEKHLQNGLLFS